MISVGSKPLALLAFLSAEAGQHGRTALADLLWPKSSSRNGLHSLSQAIYALRKACGRDAVLTAGSEHIETGLQSDLQIFRRYMSTGRWEAAAECVRGTLCEGLSGVSPAFDHWLDSARVTVLREVRSLLPELELALSWEQLGRLCDLVSDWNGQDEQLEQLRKRAASAAEGHGLEPHVGETRQPEAFVGRQEHIRQLLAVRQQVLSSEDATAVIVRGPPGIGKTALCERFLRLTALRGGISVSARGYPSESNLPFAVIEQLVADARVTTGLKAIPSSEREVLNSVFRMVPARGAPHERRPHSFSQLKIFELLRRILLISASERPLVIFIDDLQWVDPSSKSFLHYISRRPFDAGLMCLFALTTPGNGAAVDAFPEAIRVDLKGLSDAEALELTRRLSPNHVWEDEIAALLRRTGGNPLYLRALLASGPNATSTDLFTGSSPLEYLRRRIQDLSDAAQLVLASLSVLGDSAPFSVLKETVALEEAKIAKAVLELRTHDLIREEDDRIGLTHGLAGEAVLADSPVFLRRLLHGRAARYLARSGSSSPAVIAPHLDIAGKSGEAYEAALDAADASLRLSAFKEAEFFLKLALSNAATPEAEADVRIRIADIYLATSRPREANWAIKWDKWDTVRPDQRLWSRVYTLAVAFAASSDVQSILTEAWRLVAEARREDNADAAAYLLTRIAAAADAIGRLVDARRAAYQIVELLSVLPEDSRTVRYRGQAAAVFVLSESVTKAKALVEDIFSAAKAPEARGHYYAVSALISLSAGELQEAEKSSLQSIALSERYGMSSLGFKVLNNLSVCYLEMGRYGEARKCLDRALEKASDLVASQGETLIAYQNLSLVAYETGEYDRCLELLDRCSEINISAHSRRSAVSELAVRGLALLELGRFPLAFECERSLRTLNVHDDLYLPDMSYVEVFSARMHHLRGQDSKALERLRLAIQAYEDRDVFCRSRLQIEFFRINSRTEPSATLAAARQLRGELEEIGAQPLVQQLEDVIAQIP